MIDTHPSLNEISDFASGRMADGQLRRRIEEHVLTCDICSRAMESCPRDPLEDQLASLPATSKYTADSTKRYELIEEVGRGGAGLVYRAMQVGLDRQIAIKMLLHGTRANRAELSRFHRESVALARLSHPNVVQVFECGEMDGVPFIAMELVDGPTLAERLQRGPLKARTAARWLQSLADAIAQAHELGICHRDLKPQNVLLSAKRKAGSADLQQAPPVSADLPDRDFRTIRGYFDWMMFDDDHWVPRLADFGLACFNDSSRFETATGETLGTPAYIAPEAIVGRSRTRGEESQDIYGLGAILYECLTGRQPFTGSSTWEILDAVATREPVSIASLRAGVPRDLITICNRCMDKRPERRFASAGDLADDLQRFIDGRPIVSRQVSRLEKGFRWARRRPAVAIASLMGLILVTTIPLLLLYQNWSVQQERNIARTQYASVRSTLHEVLAELNRNTDSVIPEATRLAARQVARARQMFEQLADVDPSPQSDFDLARVLVQSATIEKTLGRSDQALELLDMAESRCRPHQQKEACQVEYYRGLFRIQNTRAVILQDLKRLEEADASLVAAGETLLRLESLRLDTGFPEEIELLGNRRWLLRNLGTLAYCRQDLEAAAHFYQQALDVFEQLRHREIPGPDHLMDSAELRINLASTQMQLQQNSSAESSYWRGLQELEKWAEQNSRTSKWAVDWGTAVLNRSNLLNAMERKEEAFSTLDHARKVLQQAVESDTGHMNLRNLLFMVSANRALFCPDPKLKIEVWNDAVADASRPEHLTYSRQILVRVLASHGKPLAALDELLKITSSNLSAQERFVQASCHALIAKHLSQGNRHEEHGMRNSMIAESTREAWRLLQELAENGEINEERSEHLRASEDWSAVRMEYEESGWEELLAVR